jgi:hypothetical protein
MTTLVNSHRLHTYSALLTYVNIVYQLVLRLCEVEDSCLCNSLSAVLFIIIVLEENLGQEVIAKKFWANSQKRVFKHLLNFSI